MFLCPTIPTHSQHTRITEDWSGGFLASVWSSCGRELRQLRNQPAQVQSSNAKSWKWGRIGVRFSMVLVCFPLSIPTKQLTQAWENESTGAYGSTKNIVTFSVDCLGLGIKVLEATLLHVTHHACAWDEVPGFELHSLKSERMSISSGVEKAIGRATLRAECRCE